VPIDPVDPMRLTRRRPGSGWSAWGSAGTAVTGAVCGVVTGPLWPGPLGGCRNGPGPWGPGPFREALSAWSRSVVDRLLGADTGERADLHLRLLGGVLLPLLGDRTEPAQQEG